MKKKKLPTYENGGLQDLSSILGVAGSVTSLLPGAGTAIGTGLNVLSSIASNINIPSNYVPLGENQGKYSRANGGYLNPMSSTTQQVVGNNPSAVDGVELPTARVNHDETISDTDMGPYIFSDKLINPLSGNTFAKDDKKLARGDKAAEEKYEDSHAKNTLKYHKEQRENLAKLNDILALAVEGGKGLKDKLKAANGGKLPGYQHGGPHPQQGIDSLTQEYLDQRGTEALQRQRFVPMSYSDIYLSSPENVNKPLTPTTHLDMLTSGRSTRWPQLDSRGLPEEVDNVNQMIDITTRNQIQPTPPLDYNVQGPQAPIGVLARPTTGRGQTPSIAGIQPDYSDPAGIMPPRPPVPAEYPEPMAPPPPPTVPTPTQPSRRRRTAPPTPQIDPTIIDDSQFAWDEMDTFNRMQVGVDPIEQLPNPYSAAPSNFTSLGKTPAGVTAPSTIPQGPFDDQMGGQQGLRDRAKDWYGGMSQGEKLQLGEFVGKAGMLLRGADKQNLYQNRAPITRQQFDPQNALMQQQYAANAARQALQGSTTGAGLQSNLQNLVANQMRAGAQTQTQYDQMNKQAESQYQQRLAQRQQENIGYKYATDQIRQQDQAAYWNQFRDILTGIGGYGREKVAVDENQKSVDLLLKAYPDLEKWTKKWVS